MKAGILLFDQFTALDVIGPYEVLSRLNNLEICFIGLEKRAYEDSYGMKLFAGCTIDEISDLDIFIVPGGIGIDSLLANQPLIEWIRKIDNHSKWTVSVCSGSLLLAHSGVLNNRKCTTHWRRKDQLRQYNVAILNERYVHDGKYLTSAGVSAGIDMALYLVSQIMGDQVSKLIQLAMEYDPKPPFDCGSPDKVPQELIDRLK